MISEVSLPFRKPVNLKMDTAPDALSILVPALSNSRDLHSGKCSETSNSPYADDDSLSCATRVGSTNLNFADEMGTQHTDRECTQKTENGL
jgi:hypothetical protein